MRWKIRSACSFPAALFALVFCVDPAPEGAPGGEGEMWVYAELMNKRLLLPGVRNHFTVLRVSSVQFSRSVLFDSETPWTAARQGSLSITNSWSLLKFMSIELVMPFNHIICHPLFPPSIFPSITVFSSESVLCIRWPKYWSFNFSISPSDEYSGLISFRIDWLDLLAV